MNLEVVKSLQVFQTALNNQCRLYQKLQGRTYLLDLPTVLNLKVIDLLALIREGSLLYIPYE